MNLSLEIAKRYLFGKKSTNAINIITGISVLGIAIGTAALVLILSVFNGFEGLIKGYLDDFNPDIKIELKEGKHFEINDEKIAAIKDVKGVLFLSKVIEEVALFEYNEQQKTGIIKGVDHNYVNVTQIDSAMRDGKFMTESDELNYGVFGYEMASDLNLNTRDRLTTVTIYVPKRKKKSLIESDFKMSNVYPAGSFSVKNENDNLYVLASHTMVSKLLDRKNLVSAIEIKTDGTEVSQELETLMGDKYTVKDRLQQDESHLKIMKLEKWMSFLIVLLTLLIVAFNLIGSIWMIVLDKKKDISILKSLGLTSKKIKNIFLTEGLLISGIGLVLGFIIALILFASQKQFGLVGIPEGFIMDAYPVELSIWDFVVVTMAVMIIGLIASLPPAIRASNISTYIRND